MFKDYLAVFLLGVVGYPLSPLILLFPSWTPEKIEVLRAFAWNVLISEVILLVFLIPTVGWWSILFLIIGVNLGVWTKIYLDTRKAIRERDTLIQDVQENTK